MAPIDETERSPGHCAGRHIGADDRDAAGRSATGSRSDQEPSGAVPWPGAVRERCGQEWSVCGLQAEAAEWVS